MADEMRIDPIRCDGFGMCAELLPERIRLDDWGYPIIDPRPIGETLQAIARRAVRACPVGALRLEPRAAVAVRPAHGRAGPGTNSGSPARGRGPRRF